MQNTAAVTANLADETSLPALCGPAVVELSPPPMIAVAGPGDIVRYLNSAFCSLLGKSCQELSDQPFSEAVPAADECIPVLDRLY